MSDVFIPCFLYPSLIIKHWCTWSESKLWMRRWKPPSHVRLEILCLLSPVVVRYLPSSIVLLQQLSPVFTLTVESGIYTAPSLTRKRELLIITKNILFTNILYILQTRILILTPEGLRLASHWYFWPVKCFFSSVFLTGSIESVQLSLAENPHHRGKGLIMGEETPIREKEMSSAYTWITISSLPGSASASMKASRARHDMPLSEPYNFSSKNPPALHV